MLALKFTIDSSVHFKIDNSGNVAITRGEGFDAVQGPINREFLLNSLELPGIAQSCFLHQLVVTARTIESMGVTFFDKGTGIKSSIR